MRCSEGAVVVVKQTLPSEVLLVALVRSMDGGLKLAPTQVLVHGAVNDEKLNQVRHE